MLGFLFVIYLCSVNAWNWEKKDVYSITNCNVLIENQLKYIEHPTVGDNWDYYDVTKNVHNNIACGVIYLDSNRIVIIDKEIEDGLRNHNLHIIKTNTKMTEDIMYIFKKYKINFLIEDYYPSPEWYYWVFYYILITLDAILILS